MRIQILQCAMFCRLSLARKQAQGSAKETHPSLALFITCYHCFAKAVSIQIEYELKPV